MALQGISTGTIPNDGTGDSLLAGAIKVNENFLEVYNALGDGTTLLSGNPNLTVGIITSTGLDINGNGDISGNLDVGGDLTVTGVLTYEDVTNVDSIGVVTARDGVVVLGSGITVTGVSTFYDATFLDSRLQVAGLSTFSNNVDINASVDISTDLTVDGLSDLDDVNVSAALTVTGAVDFNGALDVDGATTLDTTTIDELLTVNANIDANGDLDVDGHTELDFVNVSAGATIAGALDVNGGADLSGGEINLSSATVADLTDNRVVIAGSAGSLEDDANLTFNGSTLSVGVDLDVDGHTEVDNLQAVGVVTVTGSATIDNVRIDTNTVDTTSGNLILDSTGGIVDINDAVDISGDVDIEDTTQSTSPTNGALKVAGGVGIEKNLWVGQNLDVEGTTELDSVGVTGNATITSGDVVIATAGNGIDFSATSDGTGTATSELLDNYEEGTFTPTITQGITSPTYSAQNGYYTRIGDLMFAHIILTVNGGTANGSGVIVGGLPYTSKTGGAIANVAFTGAVGIATGINAGSFGLVPSAATTIEMRYQGDQSQIAITGTELGNAVTINVSTVHRVS
jgi:hypothetical protein